MVEVREFSQGRVVVDDRYTPLLISTFSGRADLEMAKWHTKTQDRLILDAARRGRRVVSINDSTASGRPSADARAHWAEHLADQNEELRAATLATIVVVNSSIVRGALTAIAWLSPRAREIETHATIQNAIIAGLEHLDRARMIRPVIDSTRYRAPAESSQQNVG